MAPKSVTVVLDQKDEKKHSVKYSNEAGRSYYLPNDEAATLGNPDKVKITVEAA